jgi:hypothetical protein
MCSKESPVQDHIPAIARAVIAYWAQKHVFQQQQQPAVQENATLVGVLVGPSRIFNPLN